MVYGIIGQVVRQTGIYLIPKVFRAFNRYDKSLYRQVFGATRGRALRHGRDAGLAIGGSLKGTLGRDDLDGIPQSPPVTSRQKYQARSRRSNRGYNKRNQYCPPCRDGSVSRRRKPNRSRRRMYS